ncbi:MAG: hypothetical protein KA248_00475 [Kiritimatiellae bacterium]|nr:hypothetical protein [Kiritimatiellia bacterium]
MGDHQTTHPAKTDGIDLHATLEHAQAGYQNAQDIIKFVDAKSGAVTGLCALAIGGVFGLLTWFLGLEETCRSFTIQLIHPCSAATLLLALSPIAGAVSLAFSLLSLVARPQFTTARTVLFPCFKLTRKTRDEIDEAYRNKIVGGMTKEEIRIEYHDQILNVGCILQRKIARHRVAVFFLVMQLVVMASSAFVVCSGIATKRSQATATSVTTSVASASAVYDTPPPPSPSRAPSSPTNRSSRR